MLLWESSKYYIFWVCVCSLGYPACNAHSPYCHQWSVRLYSIFPRYLINGTNFGKDLWNHKMHVLIFSARFAWKISHFKKKWARFDYKCILVFTHKVPGIVFFFSSRYYWKFNFLDWSSRNTQKSNFMNILPVGAELFHVDGQRDMTKLIVAFRNFANAPNEIDIIV